MTKRNFLINLFLTFSLIFLNSTGFASKARLTSLGEDKNGSPFLEDNRMILLNPSLLSRIKDFGTFEMGSSTVPSTPNAEGGGTQTVGPVRLAVILGRETNAATKIAVVNSVMGLSLMSPQNTFEIMANGKLPSGNHWGASVINGRAEDFAEVVPPASSNYPNKNANTLEFRGGLTGDKWHSYAHLDLAGASENQVSSGVTHKYTGKLGLRGGAEFDINRDQKIYGEATWWTFSGRNGTAAADRDGDRQAANFGFAQFIRPEGTTRFHYSVGLAYDKWHLTNSSGNPEYLLEQFYIPVTLAVESDVTDWMILRASVAQRVLLDNIKTTVTDTHNPNSTTVAAGTGFHWKKMTLDATLAGGTTGDINGTSLLSNASLTYVF